MAGPWPVALRLRAAHPCAGLVTLQKALAWGTGSSRRDQAACQGQRQTSSAWPTFSPCPQGSPLTCSVKMPSSVFTS